MLSARDPIRRRQPVERPLDIVALELLVSVSQALLAGLLLALAAQLGADARASGLPIPGLLAVLGIAVGAGWLRWLVGGSGALMTAVCLAVAILTGALWLLSLQDPSLPRIDPWLGLIAAASAIYGLIAGLFLDGPHRAHWKGGISQPHRGLPQTRTTPARFSPPVQKVVDERLSDLRLPRLALPEGRRLTLPTLGRTLGATPDRPEQPKGDGLTRAAPIAPLAPVATTASAATAEPAEPPLGAADARESATPPIEDPTTSEAITEAADTSGAASSAETTSEDAMAPTQEIPSDSLASTEAVPSGGLAPTEAPAAETPPKPADPDAPTQPVARPAPQWPRPIEPRGQTGEHPVDRRP